MADINQWRRGKKNYFLNLDNSFSPPLPTTTAQVDHARVRVPGRRPLRPEGSLVRDPGPALVRGPSPARGVARRPGPAADASLWPLLFKRQLSFSLLSFFSFFVVAGALRPPGRNGRPRFRPEAKAGGTAAGPPGQGEEEGGCSGSGGDAQGETATEAAPTALFAAAAVAASLFFLPVFSSFRRYRHARPRVPLLRQAGAKLVRVSDLIALGRATIEEALALLRWAAASGFGRAGAGEREEDVASRGGGGGGLGVTGLSMGGVHAAMVAALAPGPLAAVPMLAPRSAAAAFCRGALWRATAWEPLVEEGRARGGSGGGGGGDDAVLGALLAAAAAAPPGSAAAKVAEALAAGGWPLSAPSSSSSSLSDSGGSASAAATASAAAREALEHVLETYTDVTR